MATTNPLAYNTGSTISGTDQVGSLAIGLTEQEYSGNIGGVPWWMSPDEDLGYIIAHPVPSNTQPTPIPGTFASLGFNRTPDFTNESFINLAEYVTRKYSTPQSFSSATEASTWLTNNGFWNTYVSLGNRIMYWDVQNPTSYSAAGVTTIYDLDGNSNGTLYNGVSYWTGITNYLVTDYTSSSSYMMNNTSLNPVLNPPNTGSDISIFTWVYPLNNNGVIISEQGTANPPDQNWYDSQIELVTGTLYFRVWGVIQVVSTVDMVYQDWNYVGFTYNSTTQTLTGWVNGQLAGTSTGVRQTPYNDGGGLGQYYTFGYPTATNFGSGAGLTSRFGSLEVYNYGLPSTEVHGNYDANRINYTRGLIMDLDATNPFSYNGAGSTWYDLTAKANNGTLTNVTYSAISGGTMSFNGTSSYVSIGQPISSNSSYSISAWVYATSLVGARNIVSSMDSPFWCSSGVLYAGLGSNYTLVSYGPLQTNTWYFVSMTFNDTANRMNLYVNGAVVSTNNTVSLSYTAENTYVGSHFNGTNVSFWQGYIPQVYIYANEQSDAEVLHLFNKTKSLYGL